MLRIFCLNGNCRRRRSYGASTFLEHMASHCTEITHSDEHFAFMCDNCPAHFVTRIHAEEHAYQNRHTVRPTIQLISGRSEGCVTFNRILKNMTTGQMVHDQQDQGISATNRKRRHEENEMWDRGNPGTSRDPFGYGNMRRNDELLLNRRPMENTVPDPRTLFGDFMEFYNHRFLQNQGTPRFQQEGYGVHATSRTPATPGTPGNFFGARNHERNNTRYPPSPEEEHSRHNDRDFGAPRTPATPWTPGTPQTPATPGYREHPNYVPTFHGNQRQDLHFDGGRRQISSSGYGTFGTSGYVRAREENDHFSRNAANQEGQGQYVQDNDAEENPVEPYSPSSPQLDNDTEPSYDPSSPTFSPRPHVPVSPTLSPQPPQENTNPRGGHLHNNNSGSSLQQTPGGRNQVPRHSQSHIIPRQSSNGRNYGDRQVREERSTFTAPSPKRQFFSVGKQGPIGPRTPPNPPDDDGTAGPSHISDGFGYPRTPRRTPPPNGNVTPPGGNVPQMKKGDAGQEHSSISPSSLYEARGGSTDQPPQHRRSSEAPTDSRIRKVSVTSQGETFSGNATENSTTPTAPNNHTSPTVRGTASNNHFMPPVDFNYGFRVNQRTQNNGGLSFPRNIFSNRYDNNRSPRRSNNTQEQTQRIGRDFNGQGNLNPRSYNNASPEKSPENSDVRNK